MWQVKIFSGGKDEVEKAVNEWMTETTSRRLDHADQIQSMTQCSNESGGIFLTISYIKHEK